MDKIQGPLGFWTFPVLNTLVQMSSNNQQGQSESISAKSFNVVRDEEGRIKNVEVIEGMNDG